MDYLSTRQTAARWGVSLRQVQRLLHENRIPGAKKFGVSWLIPANSSKPCDSRRDAHAEPKPLPMLSLGADDCLKSTAAELEAGSCPLFPLLYIQNGDLAAAYARCGSAAERQLLEAGLAFFRNELPATKACLAAVDQVADQPLLRLGCCLLRGLCAMYEGEVLTWNDVLEQLSRSEPRLERDLSVAILKAALHGRQSYPNWLERGNYSDLQPVLFPVARWLYVTILYIKWQEVDLLAVVEPLLAECSREQSDLARIYLHLLAATAYRDHDKTDLCRQHIRAAVDLAQPLGIVSPFMEYRHLLMLLLDDCLKESFPQALQLVKKGSPAFFDNWTKIYNSVFSHPMAAGLTPREREACALYNRGLTAQEIAKRMGISKNSVRKYLYNAFDKLGVEKRKQLGQLIHT